MRILSCMNSLKTILAIISIVSPAYLPVEGRHGTLAANKKLRISSTIERSSFPSDFVFGAGSSAFQIEGSSHEGGRGPSVWDDVISHAKAGTFMDAEKFPTLIEHYKRYKEDVQHLKKLGIDSYRFSISWSRVLPNGTLSGGINQDGVNFYNNLIDELLANGITPFVTMYHFDLPLALQKEYGGFLNRSMVNIFKDYSELLFTKYGDRVKHWFTMNEPTVMALVTSMHGYANPKYETRCKNERICEEPYSLVHNLILAHAKTVQLYREKFQASQGGEIGLTLPVEYYVPFSSNPEDVAAAERCMDFLIGWVVEPLVFGDYPKIMRDMVKDRLPTFTEEEKKMIKGSSDFFGINYYLSHFIKHETNKTNIVTPLDNFDALGAAQEFDAQGNSLGYKDATNYNYVYPKGMLDIMLFFKHKYQDCKIYITENGIGANKLDNPLHDDHRIDFIATHLNYTKEAIKNGVKVEGYFYWGAFNTWEFQAGYSQGFGLIHIDFHNNLKREFKHSAKWYKKFIKSNNTKRQNKKKNRSEKKPKEKARQFGKRRID